MRVYLALGGLDYWDENQTSTAQVMAELQRKCLQTTGRSISFVRRPPVDVIVIRDRGTFDLQQARRWHATVYTLTEFTRLLRDNCEVQKALAQRLHNTSRAPQRMQKQQQRHPKLNFANSSTVTGTTGPTLAMVGGPISTQKWEAEYVEQQREFDRLAALDIAMLRWSDSDNKVQQQKAALSEQDDTRPREEPSRPQKAAADVAEAEKRLITKTQDEETAQRAERQKAIEDQKEKAILEAKQKQYQASEQSRLQLERLRQIAEARLLENERIERERELARRLELQKQQEAEQQLRRQQEDDLRRQQGRILKATGAGSAQATGGGSAPTTRGRSGRIRVQQIEDAAARSRAQAAAQQAKIEQFMEEERVRKEAEKRQKELRLQEIQEKERLDREKKQQQEADERAARALEAEQRLMELQKQELKKREEEEEEAIMQRKRATDLLALQQLNQRKQEEEQLLATQKAQNEERAPVATATGKPPSTRSQNSGRGTKAKSSGRRIAARKRAEKQPGDDRRSGVAVTSIPLASYGVS